MRCSELIVRHQQRPDRTLPMPREGKNGRFGRLVCESLEPHLGQTYQYTGPPHDGFRRQTSFGHRSVMVHLWGANPPYRHLEFMLGVWHDKFEAVRLQLNLTPTIAGADHSWQATGNLSAGWDPSKGRSGTRDANLNEDPTVIIPQVVPFLSEAIRVVFGACADLRRIRKLLLQGHDGPLFTSEPWQEIALIDVVLTDWQHLTEFIRRTDLPFSARRDMNLIKGIQNAFGFEHSA